MEKVSSPQEAVKKGRVNDLIFLDFTISQLSDMCSGDLLCAVPLLYGLAEAIKHKCYWVGMSKLNI